METAAIEAKIKTMIADQLGVNENDIGIASAFIDDLGADSLDIVELVMGIEEEFNLVISEDDSELIRTVNDAVEYVRNHISA